MPNPERTECLNFIDEAKNLAELTNQKPRSILKSCQIKLSNEAAAWLGSKTLGEWFFENVRNTKPKIWSWTQQMELRYLKHWDAHMWITKSFFGMILKEIKQLEE